MNNEFLEESTFLFPYYKQFIKLLKNNKIILLGNNNQSDIDFFRQANISVLEDVSKEKVDGIVLNNYLSKIEKDNLNKTLDNLNNILNDEGIILLINNKQSIDEDTIKYLFKENFEVVEELIGDDKWNFVLYQKRTTK